MISIIDALGRTHKWKAPPKRVISLVPSTTETLFRLGVWESVVGITRYCVHPDTALQDKVVVGGTKQCNIERIQALQPDLVLCNQEENTPDMVSSIEALGIPVYIAFPTSHETALLDLQNLGVLFEKENLVKGWIQKFRSNIAPTSGQTFSFLYLIWRKPWMAAGKDTFIDQQLSLIGGINHLANHPDRYITLFEKDMMEPNTHILLSSEPYPFEQQHKSELIELGIPQERIHFINGEYCSWHGVRMIDSLDYLQHWRDKHLS